MINFVVFIGFKFVVILGEKSVNFVEFSLYNLVFMFNEYYKYVWDIIMG